MRLGKDNGDRPSSRFGTPRPAKVENPYGPKPKTGAPLAHASPKQTFGKDADCRGGRASTGSASDDRLNQTGGRVGF
jgi:hypothetical protein